MAKVGVERPKKDRFINFIYKDSKLDNLVHKGKLIDLTRLSLNMAKVGINKELKVSTDLQAIIGKEKISRPQCVKALWAYIKENNLQDPDQKQYFTPDKKMAKVFGSTRMRCFSMTKFFKAHLTEVTEK